MLFIDEIHRLAPAIEEILYPAMEDYELDIVIGQGPSARSVKVPLQKFTLIGATTRAGLLTSPLRARFGIVHRLDFYTEQRHRGDRPPLGAHPRRADRRRCGGARSARRSRGTPRIANRLLRRVRDYAQVRADGRITVDVARAAMKLLEVDEHGFDEVDRKLLRTIIDKFSGGPVGVNSLAAAINEEKDAIEDIYEPFLIQAGFLDRTPRGRVATRARLRILRAHRPREGLSTVVTRRRRARQCRARISSLATYVPPRVLTNADLEKMVDTSDEWILQRTGIRERHIVDPGVATSDLATEAARKAIERAGLTPDRHRLHRRRHHDARHAVSEHRLPACSTRSARRARGATTCSPPAPGFTYALTTAAQMVADRRQQARAGHRRRRDVEHHRLHRSRRPA